MYIFYLILFFFSHILIANNNDKCVQLAEISTARIDDTLTSSVRTSAPKKTDKGFDEISLSTSDTEKAKKIKALKEYQKDGFLPVVIDEQGSATVLVPNLEHPSIVPVSCYHEKDLRNLPNMHQQRYAVLKGLAGSLNSNKSRSRWGRRNEIFYPIYKDIPTGLLLIDPFASIPDQAQVSFRSSINDMLLHGEKTKTGTYFVYGPDGFEPFDIVATPSSINNVTRIRSRSSVKAYVVKHGHRDKISFLNAERLALLELKKKENIAGYRLIDFWLDADFREVMVLVEQEGISLHEMGILHKNGAERQSPKELETIFTNIYHRLQELHAIKKLHGDIKPLNVIVSKTLLAFLIDFENLQDMENPISLQSTALFLPARVRANPNNIVSDAAAENWAIAFSFLYSFGYAEAVLNQGTIIQTIHWQKIESGLGSALVSQLREILGTSL